MSLDSAMIFAAGFGSRMGDLTKSTPKPMLSLAGRPMIDISIETLRNAGIDRLFANTHYLSDQLAPHLGRQGITVLHEERILETGGGLKAALPQIDRSVIVTMNPDCLWLGPNPVTALLQNWQPHMKALLLLVPLARAHCTNPNGDFDLLDGRIARNGPFRYTGLQILNVDMLAQMPEEKFSLNKYWDKLLDQGQVHGVIYTHEWCDVGTPEGLRLAESLLSK